VALQALTNLGLAEQPPLAVFPDCSDNNNNDDDDDGGKMTHNEDNGIGGAGFN
jgi:hypothetical protein